MKKIVSELSVFFPAYNEEGNVEKTVLDAKSILQKIADKWEIIIVDDGSKDNTGKIAKRLSKTDNRIKVITHVPNRGYGGALKSGFENSKYAWIAFTDIDGQFDFSEIKKFIQIQKQTGADCVLGIRSNRADPFMRKFYTLIWSKILPRLLLGLKVSDYSCGFKLIKKDVFEKVQPLVGEEKVTQIEMLVKAQKMGFKFTEVKVTHYPRRFGHQTGADVKVILKSLWDLIRLWKQLR